MRSIRTASAGLVLAMSLSAVSVGLAGAASAAPAQPTPHPAKGYPTWHAAQRAAGFPLLKPAKTFGHKRLGDVRVAACPRPRSTVNRRNLQVVALYGATKRPALHLIAFLQDNSRVPCLGPLGRPGGKIIARVQVDGVTAILTRGHIRICLRRSSGKPKCNSGLVTLQLRWTKRGHRYRITGIGEPRALIIGFARNLVAVK